MKLMNCSRVAVLAALFLHLCFASAGRSYVRYVNPEDLTTKVVYADSVLTSIVLPRGVAKLDNYPKFNAAAYELAEVLKDSTRNLLQVWVCGSASPEGLWAYNVRLSKARTDAAADYLKEVMNVPAHMIHKESLNEDWDRLYELVEASDLSHKAEVLDIIRTKTWGARKEALQELDGGKVWKAMVRDIFPQLRCVRFAIYCKWDQTKPYLTEPKVDTVFVPAPAPEPVYILEQVRDTVQVVDTVYVRDTVVVIKETMVVPEPAPVTHEQAYEQYREESLKKTRREVQWLKPHVMAVKTNLLSDAMAIPSLGLEWQLAKWLSLDVQGGYGFYNMFNPAHRDMKFCGVSPELRFWMGEHAMQRGSFLGLHANAAWYSLVWKNGVAYENVAGQPAWSAGITYGYTVNLGRRSHWGLEFMIGAGYGRYCQNVGVPDTEGKIVFDADASPVFTEHFGLTKVGLNLVYRFSVAGKNK